MGYEKVILLAEDDANDTELVLQALAGHRLADRVHVVADGAEALDYLYRRGKYAGEKSARPAVLLLDIHLPGIDGLEVLRQVKADPHLRLLPVVMLTSSREERDLVASYCLGANACVVKPLDSSVFADAVKSLGVFWTSLNVLPQGYAAPDSRPG